MDKAEAKQVNEAMMKKLAEIEQELGAKFGLDGSITVYKDHVSFKMVAVVKVKGTSTTRYISSNPI